MFFPVLHLVFPVIHLDIRARCLGFCVVILVSAYMPIPLSIFLVDKSFISFHVNPNERLPRLSLLILLGIYWLLYFYIIVKKSEEEKKRKRERKGGRKPNKNLKKSENYMLKKY